MVLIVTGYIIFGLGKAIHHAATKSKESDEVGGCNGNFPALEWRDAPITMSDHAGGSPSPCPIPSPRKGGVPDSVSKLMQQVQEKQKANGRPLKELLHHRGCRKKCDGRPESVISIGWTSVECTRANEAVDLPAGAVVTDEIAWYSDCWSHPFREYKERSLRYATHNYAAQIGLGGFSSVYHGMLPNGMQVAIKVTNENRKAHSNCGSEDYFNRWLSELKLARRCEHPHVVKVLGFSYQKKRYQKSISFTFRKKCLKMSPQGVLAEPASPFKGMQVLEFMENGDLSAVLESPECTMDWSTRLEVLVGSATGLAYIHSQGVVHRDIKPQNIFLDHDFCPKIGDFGISKQISLMADSPTSTSTHVSLSELLSADEDYSSSEFDSGESASPSYDVTSAKGTIGYLDPDYLSTGVVTFKSDVFSFGVTILNVVTGKKAFELADFEDDKRAKAVLLEDRVLETIDSRLRITSQQLIAQARDVIRIALLCMQRFPAGRPTMEQVVALLVTVRDTDSSSDLLESLWQEYMRSKDDFMKDINSILEHDFMKDINSSLDQQADIFSIAQLSVGDGLNLEADRSQMQLPQEISSRDWSRV